MRPGQPRPVRSLARKRLVRCDRLPVKRSLVSASGVGIGAGGWRCGTSPRRERATIGPLWPCSSSEISTSIIVRLVPISRTERVRRQAGDGLVTPGIAVIGAGILRGRAVAGRQDGLASLQAGPALHVEFDAFCSVADGNDVTRDDLKATVGALDGLGEQVLQVAGRR